MNTDKLFLVTDETGKKNKSHTKNLLGEDSFLRRALIKNAAAKKRYTSKKLQAEPVRLPASGSWLLTG